MNQSILFPEMQSWDETLQAVVFPAQQSGALIECLVRDAELEKLSGCDIESGEQALEIFVQNRFDIEDLTEALIEEEEFNASGRIDVIS